MRHHFLQVTGMHDALIRGDLAAVGQLARDLASSPPPVGMPAAGFPYVAMLGIAARQADEATSLEEASSAVSTMLVECGRCHRSTGVRPAPAAAPRPGVSGAVGSMLDHQRALDDLLQALVLPSDAHWRQGVAGLQTAALHDRDLPRNGQWTNDILRAERRVHEIATRGDRATTDTARGEVYAQLLATCAECHSLHRRISGPGQGD
jgi:cytochrome c553